MQRLLPSLLVCFALLACDSRLARSPTPAVMPSVETAAVRSRGDAADDPAIWIHPGDPSRSLIIGTNKKRGLEVYDLSGQRVQELPDGRMNNVDLRYGFHLGGRNVAIAVATNRTDKTLSIYAIDADGRLTEAADGPIPTGFAHPYGLCMYRSASSGEYFVFASSDDGAFHQWRLIERNGKVGAELVREFLVGSQAEGCAADDETGRLYVAEEDVGLWRYSAEPDADAQRYSIDDVRHGNLTDDVEGVAIYYGPNGSGYIVVSSQGSDDYALYRREGENEFLGMFHIAANFAAGIDGASETDGLDVTSASLGPTFPRGVLVVQDGRNIDPVEPQNFKLVPWERITEALSPPAPGGAR
ncbi:MAG: phytase [Steroidobacteraceae bacterium]|jgi:3-phytase|nr:phytase [Steroidobacteraceae bacterium]